ncbi:MAG: hypothetical protein RLZZ427_1860 [Pseudomonadota bacterium]|jgi:hypothetical protein
MVRKALTPALATLALVALLSGCGDGGRVQSAASKPARNRPTAPAAPKPAIAAAVRPAIRIPPPAPRRQVIPGLEGVIGATHDQLQAQFGNARLDVYEGDARKLQFVGERCVLDVFLYPPAPGREPQATYIEARRASDGLDVDDAACVNTLRKQP